MSTGCFPRAARGENQMGHQVSASGEECLEDVGSSVRSEVTGRKELRYYQEVIKSTQ